MIGNGIPLVGNRQASPPRQNRISMPRFCPYWDGQECLSRCPLYIKTIIPEWEFEHPLGQLRRKKRKIYREFEGCAQVAKSLALITLANEK